MMIPADSSAKTELTVSDSNGICKKTLAIAATNATSIPVIKKPVIKLKFFRVVSTKAEAAKKIKAVEPNANIMGSAPFTAIYILRIGPRVKPNQPVSANTQNSPLILFLFFSVIHRHKK